MIELNKIYNEDCLGEQGMKQIPDKSIDMILCDLPYGTTQNKWDTILPLTELWEQYNRIIKPNGAIVLTATQPFASILVTSNLSMFRYQWIWEKSTKTNFLNAKKQPLRKHEIICVFSNKPTTYNPQGLQLKNSFTKQGKKETSNYGKQDRSDGRYFQENTGYPHDIIFFKSQLSIDCVHPTQKPVPLFEYLIRTYTNEGEIVLDNCMGSGTTAIAAINTNRYFIGFETDPHYCEIANERIRRTQT